jgi:serine/threonine protein kinase/tetratricopeptide (TPR) repeat protein
MALTTGTRLGPYEIVGPLGAGGMGEVFRARDARLGRDVAIKALPAAFDADPDRLARFRYEAQVLASLNHPNIAAIYGLEEASGTPHLVLELIEGETLAARLARGPLPPPEALRLGIQLAGALEAAHERGIVHRDLKPGNIMITPRGTAKVLDFGLARSDVPPGSAASESATRTAPAHATMAGAILGTAAYLSPEQARGQPVDRRSDVWSFGCVLFECFAGRQAFGGATVSDLIARILEREPDWSALPAGTPPRGREILRRCLRKEAEGRPRDIRDVRLELEEIADGAKADPSREKSIAVLPFENQGGPDDEYFADGVTDEILNALAQVPGLRVAARTSCFAFKGRREDLRLVGERLDVGTVLEGTVRRSGPRLRITVQMVNAADGYQLWSERYDREMTDVFAVQDEIAGAIATRLRGTIDAAADRGVRGRTRNLEAYELLLRGRALQMKRGRFVPQAIVCFEQAIALDPRYAEAMASLADSYRLIGVFGSAPPSEVMPKALTLAERALAIDPSLADAWTTMAAVEEQYHRHFARSDELYERALALEPRHSQARAQRALWRACRGAMPVEDAVAEVRRAVQDDPLNAWVGGMHSQLLGLAGRHEESVAEADRSLTLDADSFYAHWNVMRSHAWAGRYDRAIQEAPTMFAISGRHTWALGLLAWTYGRAGRAEEARAVYDELEARSRHEFVSLGWLAMSAGSAGLLEESFRWAERAVAERDPLVLWARNLLFWNPVRAHPRFAEVMRGVWE